MEDLSDIWQETVRQLALHHAVEKRKSLSVFYCLKASVKAERRYLAFCRAKNICEENLHLWTRKFLQHIARRHLIQYAFMVVAEFISLLMVTGILNDRSLMFFPISQNTGLMDCTTFFQ